MVGEIIGLTPDFPEPNPLETDFPGPEPSGSDQNGTYLRQIW